MNPNLEGQIGTIKNEKWEIMENDEWKMSYVFER